MWSKNKRTCELLGFANSLRPQATSKVFLCTYLDLQLSVDLVSELRPACSVNQQFSRVCRTVNGSNVQSSNQTVAEQESNNCNCMNSKGAFRSWVCSSLLVFFAERRRTAHSSELWLLGFAWLSPPLLGSYCRDDPSTPSSQHWPLRMCADMVTKKWIQFLNRIAASHSRRGICAAYDII